MTTALVMVLLLAAPDEAGDASVDAGEELIVDAGLPTDPLFVGWTSLDGPGCAVSVVRDGQVLLETAYGSADLEHDIANTPTTRFESGSLAKQFTAAAIIRLQQLGKLKVEDDVRKYIPELLPYPKPVTLEMLLVHTSGLRDWGDLEQLAGSPRFTRIHTNADVLELTRRQKSLNFAPGSVFSYTNTGYALLAEVVRRVSGRSLAAFTDEQLFIPLGMTATQWRDDFARVVKGRAIAYAPSLEGWRQRMPMENVVGPGGLLTTVGDLQKWNAALTARTFGDAFTSEMERRGVLSNGRQLAYARGIGFSNVGAIPEWSHAGGTAGYKTWLARFPMHKLSVALLCNAGDVRPEEVGGAVARLFLPPRMVTTPLEPRAPFVDVEARAGIFASPTGVPMRLVARGGTLMVSGEALHPVSANVLRLGERRIEFSGRDKFELKTENDERSTWTRVRPAMVSSSMLIGYTGVYRSDELGVDYRVELKDKVLVMRVDRRTDPPIPLEVAYRDAFLGGDVLVRFRRSNQGAVNEISLSTSRVWDLRLTRH